VDRAEFDLAIAAGRGVLEFDAGTRTYGGHREVRAAEGHPVRLTHIRAGTRAVGLLATAGRSVDPGTLDAVAGLAAIAIERATLLDDRRDAERIRQGAELKSALLSSLSHDLQTPLTAIRVASDNLQSDWSDEFRRREQLDIVTSEVSRLNRLFQNIVEMARIESGAIDAAREWVHTADIVEAARRQVESALRDHPIDVHVHDDEVVQVDPRLTAAALAHLLENAGRYSPAGAPIVVTSRADTEEFVIAVRDHGPGLAGDDLDRLFERFYRGPDARRQTFGTGMGLAITRGLLAAQHGRVWAENHPDGGALFTMAVPTSARAAERPPEEA
jgi:two-component system sensor histidine kinase KdpD